VKNNEQEVMTVESYKRHHIKDIVSSVNAFSMKARLKARLKVGFIVLAEITQYTPSYRSQTSNFQSNVDKNILQNNIETYVFA
jgi:hypothetical protein